MSTNETPNTSTCEIMRTARMMRNLVLVRRERELVAVDGHATAPMIETQTGLLIPTEAYSGNNIGTVVNHGPLAKVRNGDLVLWPDEAIVQPIAEASDDTGDYVLYAGHELFTVLELCRVEA
jgi:hypothetical protein